MSSVYNWRPAASGYDFSGYNLPEPNALKIDRRYEIPQPEPVRVEALSATWCMDGRTVTPGTVYSVAPDAAASLVYRGKAKYA